MKSISLAKLHAVAPSRKPGYVEAVMAAATAVSDTHITLEEQDFDRIRREYAQSVSLLQKAANFAASGPGTEMKALLAKIGIVASPNCSCNKRARIMDEKGCDWCEAHIDEIDGWLAEEAKTRKLPYLSLAGRLLISLAIRRARKRDNKS
jgi:hypothetical protein